MTSIPRRALGAALALGLAAGAVAQDATPVPHDGTGFFIDLFGSLCVQGGGRPEVVEDAMTTSGIAPLPAAEAAPFLQGRPGQVWPVLAPSGPYRVVLREDGSCSVLAQRADARAVDAAFEDFLRGAPLKDTFRLVKTTDERKKRDGISTHLQRYEYGIPGKPGAFRFTLTTSTSVESAVQAMATFAPGAGSVPIAPFK